MLIKPELFKKKPYYSAVFVEGRPETLEVRGHISMEAAKRASVKNMRTLRARLTDESPMSRPPVTWAFGIVLDEYRLVGVVL